MPLPEIPSGKASPQSYLRSRHRTRRGGDQDGAHKYELCPRPGARPASTTRTTSTP